MSTPCRLAAWMMVSPAKAETVSPFSLNSMTSVPTGGSFIFIVSNLVRKMLRDASNRVRRRLSQAADGCVRHRHRKFLEKFLVPLGGLHQARGLRRADAARRALAAGLVLEETHEVLRGVPRLVVLREDDHRRRADEAAVGLQRVEVERDVAHRRGKDASRCATRKVGVELVAVEHAAAVLGDELLHGDARGRDVNAWLLHAARDREGAQSLAAMAPFVREPLGFA